MRDVDDEFRELVVAELGVVINDYFVSVRKDGYIVDGVDPDDLAGVVANRFTCPDCEFLDVGIGNVGNRCNDCAPRYVRPDHA